VIIERNVWIGMNVKIRPGITIGEGAIIGLGAVVTRNVEPFEIVGASAPVHIRKRDQDAYNVLEKKTAYGAENGLPWNPGATVSKRGIGDGSNVVFVCSTGRSGSQSIAKNLNRHSQITARHEPYFNLIRLSTEFAHGLKSAEVVKNELLGLYQHASTIPSDKPVYFESDQKLSNLVPLIHELFPQAKFLWLIRNGCDVVASTYARGWFGDITSSGKNAIYSEFRLAANLADPRIDDSEWNAMSGFERNCWYWGFWNSEIYKNFSHIDNSKTFVLRLEDFEQELPTLFKWLGVENQSVKSETHNRATSYRPHAFDTWSDLEIASFRRWCAPLMEKFYPDKVAFMPPKAR